MAGSVAWMAFRCERKCLEITGKREERLSWREIGTPVAYWEQ